MSTTYYFHVNFFLLLALLKTPVVILISLKDSWLIAFLNSTLTLVLMFNKSKQTAFLVQQLFFLLVLLFPIVLLVVLIILQLISSGLGYRSLIILMWSNSRILRWSLKYLIQNCELLSQINLLLASNDKD